MSTGKVLTIASIVAMLFAPAVFAAGNAYPVLGEKQDSGLGDLSPSYAASEFRRGAIAGEKLDSKLGDLPASYTAA